MDGLTERAPRRVTIDYDGGLTVVFKGQALRDWLEEMSQPSEAVEIVFAPEDDGDEDVSSLMANLKNRQNG